MEWATKWPARSRNRPANDTRKSKVKILNCRPVAHVGGGRFRDVAVFDAEVVDGLKIIGLKLALAPDGKRFVFSPVKGGQRFAQFSGVYAKLLSDAAYQALSPMSHLKFQEMVPFSLPAGFGGDDVEPTVEFVDIDQREHALDALADYAEILFGDIVLVPFEDGEPDWGNTTRDTITKFAGHWTEIEPEDVRRLGILTDSFDRFLGADANDVSVVTLWRGGTPTIMQIEGDANGTALDLIMDAIINDEPLQVIADRHEAANDNHESASDSTASDSTAKDTDETAKPLLKVVKPSDWQGKPVPRREWFAADLIPARNVTLLSGDGGTGKSLVALQIGVASALGGVEAIGMKPMPGRVFYLGAEDEEDEFQRRIVDILASHRCELADLGDNFRLSAMAGEDATLAFPNKAKHMVPTSMMAALIEEITDFDPHLLVLDTSADLFGGEEINRMQVRQFVGMLRKIAMKIDCAVLLLSHPSLTGMQSGSGLSGSTAWNNSVRSRLYLTGAADDPDARVLTNVKSNYGQKGGAIKLRWHDGVFALDDGKETPFAGLFDKQAEEIFVSLLSRFNRQNQPLGAKPGTNYAPARMAEHPDANGCPRKRLAAAMQRLIDKDTVRIITEGPPSKPRNRLILASEDFGPENST
jgi:RecA-family ATPase